MASLVTPESFYLLNLTCGVSGLISGKIFCGAVASKSHVLIIANRRICFLFMICSSPLILNEKQNGPHNGGPNEEY
jgi:hypothetical protein